MGHILRSAYFDSFKEQLGNDLRFSIDDGTLGVWGNARNAWAMVNTESDYGLVIQDDAILCDNFKTKAEQFIEQHDGQTISFYYGDDPTHNHFIKPNHFDTMLNHAVALAIPTKQIPDMIQYCDFQPECTGDDMKMRRWLISQQRTCRYSNPSLVQHRDIESIVDPDKPKRQSNIFNH